MPAPNGLSNDLLLAPGVLKSKQKAVSSNLLVWTVQLSQDIESTVELAFQQRYCCQICKAHY